MIDLSFHPEHLDALDGLFDVEVPHGWTIGQLIEKATMAKAMLWAALNYINDDGEELPKWK